MITISLVVLALFFIVLLSYKEKTNSTNTNVIPENLNICIEENNQNSKS